MIEELKEYLSDRPAGQMDEDESGDWIGLLVNAWEELTLIGYDDSKIDSKKLGEKILEEPNWEPPVLSFKVERHGARVGGRSKQAEMQQWIIDLDEDTKRFHADGYRLLEPNAKRVDVKPIAEKLASAIINVSDDPDLKWMDDGSVRVLIGDIFPNEGPSRTWQGRRRRFNEHLLPILEEAGWAYKSSNRYRAPLISK